MNSLVVTIYRWLSLLGVSVEEAYIRQRLLSHPDFPSAFSITSLLDELGIENAVAQLDKDQLHEMATPFLAFVGDEDFILVSNVATVEQSVGNFWSRWSGIVILAEKPEHIAEPEVLQNIKNSVKAMRIKRMFASSLVVLLGVLAAWQLSMSASILFIVNLTGLVVCGSIVLRELGVVSGVSKKLCGERDTTGCDTVLSSKTATLLPGIKLSDAGVAFFAGTVILLLMSSFSGAAFRQAAGAIMGTLYFASFPFTLFSIYYQAKVIKSWCRMCLLVVALLWVNVFVQLWGGAEIYSADVVNILAAAALFVLPGAVWLLIRQILNQRHALTIDNLRLQRFYRNPELLKAHLLTQEQVNTTPRPYDFQIGNAGAPCQLIVVSSHFCGHCAETFRMLQRLLAKHGNTFGITLRFLDNNPANGNGRKASVQRHMLQYALPIEGFLNDPEKVERMLEAWYATMNIDTFRKLYPVKNLIDVDFILERQREWARAARIAETPTVIINGYKLGSPYSADDLLEFGDVFVELFGVAVPLPEEDLATSEV